MKTLPERIEWAYRNLKPVEPKYCIIYEDKIDEPLQICTPSNRWLAMALHGNLIPPVWVYHALEHERRGDILYLTNGHLLHETPPIGPLTEEEAMEYLLQWHVPIHVWINEFDNRPKYKIVSREQIPQDRTFRNAWSLSDG